MSRWQWQCNCNRFTKDQKAAYVYNAMFRRQKQHRFNWRIFVLIYDLFIPELSLKQKCSFNFWMLTATLPNVIVVSIPYLPKKKELNVKKNQFSKNISKQRILYQGINMPQLINLNNLSMMFHTSHVIHLNHSEFLHPLYYIWKTTLLLTSN